MKRNTKKSKENLKESLIYLTKKIIADKNLLLPTKEYTFDNCLITNEIIKIQNDNYEIIDFSKIALHVIESYKTIFKFELKIEFNENAEFIKKIGEHFNLNKHVYDYYKLEKKIWQLIIEESNLIYAYNFNEYLNSISKETHNNEIYKFIEAYSSSLPRLNLSIKNIYHNTNLLIGFSKSDNVDNFNLGFIFDGVKQKSKTDYSFGLELFNFLFTNSDSNESFVASVISGLYEKEREIFYNSHLNEKIENAINLNAIFVGLSNVYEINNDECEKFIQLYDRFKSNENLKISLISLLIAVIKSSNSKYYKVCFEKIICSINEENTVNFILHNVCYLQNIGEEKSDLLVKLIQQEYFTIDKYLKPIEHFFWYLKDIESFRKVVNALAENVSFKTIAKAFQSTLRTIDRLQLDNFLIELLTSDKASHRYIGIDLLNELSSQIPYKFSFDILTLAPIIQYKLLVTITQDLKEPKDNIPALIPLLNSKSEFIKESFICKLEEISEDYGGIVTNILENNFIKKNKKNQIIIERIKSYISNFYEMNVNLKDSIKEFNPYYTQSKSFKSFNVLFHKNMSEKINNGVDENSFLRHIVAIDSPLILSKGGGYKIGKEKNISQLSSFESSFSLPRSYFINPNDFEINVISKIQKNWKPNDFIEIINFLENE